MGWTKVCSTAQSGIWVLKGNARACMLPENLDHLRMGWISRGAYETAWVTSGHDCLCHTCVDVEQPSDHKQRHLGWGYWFVVQGRTTLVTLVCKGECANGSEPEAVLWFRIMYPLAQR